MHLTCTLPSPPPFRLASAFTRIFILSDDGWTTSRHQGEPVTLLRGSGWGGNRVYVGRLGAWACLEETSVWLVLLQRGRARKKKVWSPGMEYPVWVHSLGSWGTPSLAFAINWLCSVTFILWIRNCNHTIAGWYAIQVAGISMWTACHWIVIFYGSSL